MVLFHFGISLWVYLRIWASLGMFSVCARLLWSCPVIVRQLCLEDTRWLSCYLRPSLFFFSYLPLKECYFIFKSSFQTRCALLYQAVHSTIILSLHLIFLWFQLVYSDAAEKGISGISQIYFSSISTEKVCPNLKAWMYHGNWERTSGFLRIAHIPSACLGYVGVFGRVEGGWWCLSVLLALLFILVTSIRIYHSVVWFSLMLLNRHTTWWTLLNFIFTFSLFFQGSY